MKPVLSSSIHNCHVYGLDSIVFKASAPMVRVYLAHEDHVLWKNWPTSSEVMSLGLHEHRTDITMIPLFGDISNVRFRASGVSKVLSSYVYSSKIRDGKGSFEPVRSKEWGSVTSVALNYPTLMPARIEHSVYVPKGQSAAWMIAEGAPSNNYSPMLYTNDHDLEAADLSNLYQPMTQEQLDRNMEILSTYL